MFVFLFLLEISLCLCFCVWLTRKGKKMLENLVMCSYVDLYFNFVFLDLDLCFCCSCSRYTYGLFGLRGRFVWIERKEWGVE